MKLKKQVSALSITRREGRRSSCEKGQSQAASRGEAGLGTQSEDSVAAKHQADIIPIGTVRSTEINGEGTVGSKGVMIEVLGAQPQFVFPLLELYAEVQ